MVTDRTRGIHNLCLLCLMLLTTATYCGMVMLLVWNTRIPMDMEAVRNYLFYLEFLLVGLVLGFKTKDSGHDLIDRRWGFANRNALRQGASALFAVLVVVMAFGSATISRVFIFGFLPLLYVTLLLGNRYLPGFIARRWFAGSRAERILLIGARSRAAELKTWLKHKELIGFRTVGILTDDATEIPGADFAVLGGTRDIEEVAISAGITQVIFVDLPLYSKALHENVLVCERLGIRLLAASNLDEQFGHAVMFFEDDGRRFVGLRDEPLEYPLNQVLKRALDIAVSLPVTVLILPPMTLLVWFLQRIQSPGPVFFVQTRAGMQNRTFKIYKYRTMHANIGDESRQAAPEDDRTFPAGRWLRKFSLDELPQFFNVLTGEMSVVGPRPHMSEHNQIFARALNNFRVRANVKPGITGLAQVRGFRGRVNVERDIVERVNSDIYYLEHWSCALDCFIILKTVGQVILPPRTAY